MSTRDPLPRMPALPPQDYTDETRAFFDRWTRDRFKEGDKNPMLGVFAHHPRLAGLFSEFNLHLLLTNTLPVKQRQIAIMRTAWITGTVYMWSSHLNTSLSFGLSDEMFDPIKVGAQDPYFTGFERWVIRATEELVEHHKVSTEAWTALMEEWSNQQMLDFLFTVGCYVAIAGVMQSTGVAREPDLIALAERYGAPTPV